MLVQGELPQWYRPTADVQQPEPVYRIAFGYEPGAGELARDARIAIQLATKAAVEGQYSIELEPLDEEKAGKVRPYSLAELGSLICKVRPTFYVNFLGSRDSNTILRALAALPSPDSQAEQSIIERTWQTDADLERLRATAQTVRGAMEVGYSVVKQTIYLPPKKSGRLVDGIKLPTGLSYTPGSVDRTGPLARPFGARVEVDTSALHQSELTEYLKFR